MNRMPNESRFAYEQRMKIDRAERLFQTDADGHEFLLPKLEFVDIEILDKILEGRQLDMEIEENVELIKMPCGKVIKSLNHPDIGQPGSRIHGGMITPDQGTAVARGSSGRVMAWDVDSGALLWCKAAHGAGGDATLPGMTGRGHVVVTCLAVSRDGKMVASAGNGAAIKVWGVRTGAEVACVDLLRLNEPLLYDIYYRGGVVAEARGDPYPFLHTQANRPDELEFLRSTHDVLSMAFSPDGKVLAAGMCVERASGMRAQPLLVVDVDTWQMRPATWYLPNVKPGTQPRAQIQLYYDTTSVDFSPDGRWCVTASLEGARLYEVRHGAGTEASAADVVAANVGRPEDADDPRRLYWPQNVADLANAGWMERGFVGYSEDAFPDGEMFFTHDVAFVHVSSLSAGEHCILILHEHGILEGRRIGNDGIIDADVDKPWFIYTQDYFGKRMRLSPDRRWLVGGRPGTFKLAEIATLADRTAPTVSISASPRMKTAYPARPQAKVDRVEARQDRTKRQWKPLDLDELMKEVGRERKEK